MTRYLRYTVLITYDNTFVVTLSAPVWPLFICRGTTTATQTLSQRTKKALNMAPALVTCRPSARRIPAVQGAIQWH